MASLRAHVSDMGAKLSLLERHVGNLSSAVMSTITLDTETSHNTLLKHVQNVFSQIYSVIQYIT